MTDFELAYLASENDNILLSLWGVYITTIFAMLVAAVTVAARLTNTMVGLFVGIATLFWLQNLLAINSLTGRGSRIATELQERPGDTGSIYYGGAVESFALYFFTGMYALHILAFAGALAFFFIARRAKFSIVG
jgi:hypothetical protein